MKKLFLILALLFVTISYPTLSSSEQICQNVEKSMRIIGNYNDVIKYANRFNLKISRIVQENDTTFKLYYWITYCFNM